MIDLLNLEPTKISTELKGKYILIYGRPKIGKTTLASEFPKNLLLAFEPGYNALNNKMVQPITKWAEFLTVINQLGRPEVQEKFSTITIDTADIAWDYCEKYICASNPKDTGEIPKNLGEIPWGKGFDLCKKAYDDAFRKIATLGYGLVFISHEQIKNVKTEKGEEYQKIMPTLPDRPKLIVNRLVDIIAYLRESLEDGKRYIYTRGNEKFEAGSRFPLLEPKIEMSYHNLVEKLYEAIEKQASDDNTELSQTNSNAAFFKDNRKFKDVIAEAKAIFQKLIEKDRDKYAVEMNNIILKIFNKPIKLSEATPDQQELVELVIEEWKNLLQE